MATTTSPKSTSKCESISMTSHLAPISARSFRARGNRLTSVALAALVAASAFTVGLFAAPQSAHAQDLETPRRRQGYYLAAGYAMGATKNADDGNDLGVGAGGLFAIRLGQMLTPRFGLGLMVNSFGSAANKTHSKSAGSTLGLEGQVELATNLALHGQVGLAFLQNTNDDKLQKDRLGGYGAMYGLDLSYEWFPRTGNDSGGFALTPTFSLRALPTDSANTFGAFLGLQIAWWTGLPKNQLILPDADAYKK